MATPAPSYMDSSGNFGMPATPATPAEPAAVTSARSNPLYIGSTNFGNLQKQYTPYQIEQATTRDASGNIFYKQGIDITKVPTAAPGTKFNAPSTIPTPGTDNLPKLNTPAPETFTTPAPQTAADLFSTGQSEAAKTYLSGIQLSIDNLLKQQQTMQEEAKKVAQGEVDTLKTQFNKMANSTQAVDQLAADRKLFQVEQNIRTFSEIQSKINDATAALDQGIIYEQSQPVRMALLTGRSAELKKQGLAHIGALQATAELVKGNIELARAYASDSLAAIKSDYDQRKEALNTLMTMANNKLVTLTKDEKDTIDARMKMLTDQADQITKNQNELLDIAQKYPLAFTQGGVLLTDTPSQAIAKMASFMSAEQKLDLEQKQLEIQKTKAEINKIKAGSSGSGSGAGTGSSGEPLAQEISQYIAYLRAQGKDQVTIRNEVYSNYSGKFKKLTDLAGIVDNVLQGVVTEKPKTPQELQNERVLTAQQQAEKDGSLSLNMATGEYEALNYPQEVALAIKDGKIEFKDGKYYDKTNGNKVIPNPSNIRYNDNGFWQVKHKLTY